MFAAYSAMRTLFSTLPCRLLTIALNMSRTRLLVGVRPTRGARNRKFAGCDSMKGMTVGNPRTIYEDTPTMVQRYAIRLTDSPTVMG